MGGACEKALRSEKASCICERIIGWGICEAAGSAEMSLETQWDANQGMALIAMLKNLDFIMKVVGIPSSK